MDERYMKAAIEEAMKALEDNEVPIGAVIVKNDEIISRTHNLRETLKNATAHAEILAINDACRKLSSWRLLDCDMYVTLEPCPMCAGAAVNARIKRIAFGAYDIKAGACGSIMDITNNEKLNHRIEVVPGMLEDECRFMLQEFFKMKRQKS